MTGADNGYSLRRLAPLVDFVGPHSYPMQDDELRQLLTPAFACELAGSFGKPVVLEEFGVSSDFASDENAAAYYRQVLHTTLLAGARGWLAWNNSDYDGLRDEDPYRHHVFELHFGLTDSARAAEVDPPCDARVLDARPRARRDGWEPERRGAAIVVPEHFERELPFTDPAYRRDIRDNLLQAYVAAREADLPVGFVRELDGLETDAQLLLAPCAKLLTAPGHRPAARARRTTARRSTSRTSRAARRTSAARGSPGCAELFGVEHRLRYGLVDPIEDDEVVLEFVADLGELTAGTRLSFRVAGEPSARAPTCRSSRSAPRSSRSTATAARRSFATGLGAGQTVLCTYPLEHMAARTPWANPENTWRIYSALAALAGVERRVRVDDPQVLAGIAPRATRETSPCSSTAPRLPSRSSRSSSTRPATGRHGLSSSRHAARRRSGSPSRRPTATGGTSRSTLALAASPLTKGGMPTSDLRPTHDAT